jgi:hypothetical protein
MVSTPQRNGRTDGDRLEHQEARMPARKRAVTARKKPRKTARKKRGKRVVTSPIEILNDVRNAVHAGAGKKQFAPAAADRLDEIFEQTVGRFRRRMRATKPNYDIWRSRSFKAYILRVARRIGRDAAQTNRTEISAADLNASAVDIMMDENRACRVRIDEYGAVTVDPPSDFHGPVCSEFLADQGA